MDSADQISTVFHVFFSSEEVILLDENDRSDFLSLIFFSIGSNIYFQLHI